MCMKSGMKNMAGGFGTRYAKKKYDSAMRPDAAPKQEVYTPEAITPKTPKKPKAKNISSLQISKDY